MQFKDETYLRYDPFVGDPDVDIRCHRSKILTARKRHDCMLAVLVGKDAHSIEPGERAYGESAIVDGVWESCHSCLRCFDYFLINNVGLEPNKSLKRGG